MLNEAFSDSALKNYDFMPRQFPMLAKINNSKWTLESIHLGLMETSLSISL